VEKPTPVGGAEQMISKRLASARQDIFSVPSFLAVTQ
jgi:hypothetical protein